MNLRVCAWVFAASLMLASCGTGKGSFRQVRTWKFPDGRVAMAFYVAEPDQTEEAVRRAAEGFADELLKGHPQAKVIVLYDAAHARKVSSGKAMENLMKGGGGSVNDFLYGGKREGGGYLSKGTGKAPPQWTYIPFRDTEASSRDRAFSK